MKKVLLILALVMIVGGGAYFFVAKKSKTSAAEKGGEIIFQCAMHPWIKAPQGGTCTICGMQLTPQKEGATSGEFVNLSTEAIQVLHVRSEPVQRGKLVRELHLSGTVDDNASRHRVLSAFVDGRIEQLQVTFAGAEIEANQPLAVLYSPALVTAERELAALLKQTNFAGSSLGEEQQRLIRLAEERLQRLGLTTEQIRRLRENPGEGFTTQVLAPFSGTVVEKFVFEGQYVREGDKLFEVADFSTMWFMFEIYERDLPWVHPGQKVQVTTPAVPGLVMESKVDFIDPNISEMTRSTRGRIVLTNPVVEVNGLKRRLLPHRGFAQARIRAELGDSLLIPRSAVLNPSGQPVAYVDLGEGNFEPRQLRLGRVGDHHYEVLDGVKEGELIVANGNLLIDAQAQLNRGFTPAPAAVEEAPQIEPAKLSADQRRALAEYLSALAAASSRLAADDLPGYSAVVPKLKQSLQQLAASFPGDHPLKGAIDKMNSAPLSSQVNSLTIARKEFHALATPTVQWARVLKGEEGFAAFNFYQCPMTDQAVEGAARKGFWVQQGGPLRNPYFGAEMLECGTELKR
jgi:Cu(I)/Ag(I) efflux system membrane fusion protein